LENIFSHKIRSIGDKLAFLKLNVQFFSVNSCAKCFGGKKLLHAYKKFCEHPIEYEYKFTFFTNYSKWNGLWTKENELSLISRVVEYIGFGYRSSVYVVNSKSFLEDSELIVNFSMDFG